MRILSEWRHQQNRVTVGAARHVTDVVLVYPTATILRFGTVLVHGWYDSYDPNKMSQPPP